jgi:phage host-nuclease inhibitor protein Gam
VDVETAEAVETLRADIGRVEREVVRVETSLTARIEHVETSLTARIEDVETSLTARIDHVETSLTAKIDYVEASLTAKIDGVETSLTAAMHELHEDGKRHTDVRIESVRDDIRILAEGFASLSMAVESLRR